MAHFVGEDLHDSRFERVRLRGARFSRVELDDALFHAVGMIGARSRGVDLTRAVMRGVLLDGVDIDGEIGRLTINGVEVGHLSRARDGPSRGAVPSGTACWSC